MVKAIEWTIVLICAKEYVGLAAKKKNKLTKRDLSDAMLWYI